MANPQKPIVVEWDEKSLAGIKEKLSPGLYAEVFSEAIITTIHYAEGAVKDDAPEPGVAPYSVGNTRRALQSDVKNAVRDPDPRAWQLDPVAALSCPVGKLLRVTEWADAGNQYHLIFQRGHVFR